MATYLLQKPAYVATVGNPIAQNFKAGDTITVADDMVPADSWIPQDDAAEVAKAARERQLGFTVAPNGLQVIDRESGRVRVVRNGGGVPR